MMYLRLRYLSVFLSILLLPLDGLWAANITYSKTQIKIFDTQNDIHFYRIDKEAIENLKSPRESLPTYPDAFLLGQRGAPKYEWWAAAQALVQQTSLCTLITPGGLDNLNDERGYGYQELLQQTLFRDNALLRISENWGNKPSNIRSQLSILKLTYQTDETELKTLTSFLGTRIELIEKLFTDCKLVSQEEFVNSLSSGPRPDTYGQDAPSNDPTSGSDAQSVDTTTADNEQQTNNNEKIDKSAEVDSAGIGQLRSNLETKNGEIRKLQAEISNLKEQNQQLENDKKQANDERENERKKVKELSESNKTLTAEVQDLWAGATARGVTFWMLFWISVIEGVLIVILVWLGQWWFDRQLEQKINEKTNEHFHNVAYKKLVQKSERHLVSDQKQEFSEEQGRWMSEMTDQIDKALPLRSYIEKASESVQRLKVRLQLQQAENWQHNASGLEKSHKENLNAFENLERLRQGLQAIQSNHSLDIGFLLNAIRNMLENLYWALCLTAFHANLFGQIDEAAESEISRLEEERDKNSTLLEMAKGDIGQLDARVDSLEKSLENEQRQMEKMIGYIAKDLQASGYIASDFTYQTNENRFQIAMESAQIHSSEKPELQNYVRSLIRLRDHLQVVAITESDYYSPSGLPNVWKELEDKEFYALYKAKNLAEALKAQWRDLAQHVFRAALLLKTYWGRAADDLLIARLDDTMAATRFALLRQGLAPHALELLVNRDWIEERQGWISGTRNVDEALLEAKAFRSLVMPCAQQGPVYCDVVTWGLDATNGTTVEKSILAERQPSDHWG